MSSFYEGTGKCQNLSRYSWRRGLIVSSRNHSGFGGMALLNYASCPVFAVRASKQDKIRPCCKFKRQSGLNAIAVTASGRNQQSFVLA
jgi:hypothetical protein